MIWFGCHPLKTSGETDLKIIVYPNPRKGGNSFFIESPEKKFNQFKIVDINGLESETGNISDDNELILKNELSSGIHFLILVDLKTGSRYVTKLIAH